MAISNRNNSKRGGKGRGSRNDKSRDEAVMHISGSNHQIFQIGRDVQSLTLENLVTRASSSRKGRLSWAEELVGLLTDRATELGLALNELIEIAATKLGRRVADLTELSADELARLYELIHALKRPALE